MFNEIWINVSASVIASGILIGGGYLWGKYQERRRFGRRLEEYDFYPYSINRDNFPEFNLNNFRLGMHYFLRNDDPMAARQLIFIGEQNNVRSQLEPTEQKVYARVFDKYDGKKIADDTSEYLENFARITRLIGNHRHGMALQPCEPHNHISRPARGDLAKPAAVDYAGNHVTNVVVTAATRR